MKNIFIIISAVLPFAFSANGQTLTNWYTSAGTSNGTYNTNYGDHAGAGALSTTNYNSFFGYYAGASTTGSNNSGFGSYALYHNTSGYQNTAAGYSALYTNTTGFINTAIGSRSLYSNTSGNSNVAIGFNSLTSNTTGVANTGVGHNALAFNTTAWYNTGVGINCLFTNDVGTLNTAVGYKSLYANTNGGYNVAVGYLALTANSTGTYNTAFGMSALQAVTTNYYNTAEGYQALAYATGSQNTGIGYGSGPSSATPAIINTTCIGYGATATASNTIVVGNSSTTAVKSYNGVYTVSDGRFKNDVKEDVAGLEFIMKLRPVSYTFDAAAYDKFYGVADSLVTLPESNRSPIERTGFIAQEVEAALQASGGKFSGVLAPRSAHDGYHLSYTNFVVPLVKAVQEISALIDNSDKHLTSLQTNAAVLASGHSGGPIATEGKIVLYQNVPNPFTRDTQISVTLPESSKAVRIVIYNLNGDQLNNIIVIERGDTSVSISAGTLKPGIYLYSLVADGKIVDTKRMILVE